MATVTIQEAQARLSDLIHQGDRQESPHSQHPPARSGKLDLCLDRLPVALALGGWRTSLRSWDKIPILSWLNPSKSKRTRLESCPTREILGRRSPNYRRVRKW